MKIKLTLILGGRNAPTGEACCEDMALLLPPYTADCACSKPKQLDVKRCRQSTPADSDDVVDRKFPAADGGYRIAESMCTAAAEQAGVSTTATAGLMLLVNRWR